MESENVKERLSTLIQKKISDQQERENKEVKATDESHLMRIKEEPESNDATYQESASAGDNKKKIAGGANGRTPDDHYKHISLQEVLNEKKKALLQNEEVVRFLSNKRKYF